MMTTDPTKQPLPPTSPLAAALDAPLGGPAQPLYRLRDCVQDPHYWEVVRGGIHVVTVLEKGEGRASAERYVASLNADPKMNPNAIQPPPPPVATPPARTLAEELSAWAKNYQMGEDEWRYDAAYGLGFQSACNNIAADLVNHPALQQPAPVAADGAPAGVELAESLKDAREAWRCGKVLAERLAAAESRAREAEALRAERDGLRTIVDRLPKTADGVPVLDGDTIYCPSNHAHVKQPWEPDLYCCEGRCWCGGCQNDSGSGEHYRFEKCFSDRDACDRARAALGGGTPA